jgi:hypothetical protein
MACVDFVVKKTPSKLIIYICMIPYVIVLIAKLILKAIVGIPVFICMAVMMARFPVEKVVQQSSVALRDQVRRLEELADGNIDKQELIDVASLFYILHVARALGSRKMYGGEIRSLWISVLGEHYNERIDSLMAKGKGTDFSEFGAVILIDDPVVAATNEVRYGMPNTGGYLIRNAQRIIKSRQHQ